MRTSITFEQALSRATKPLARKIEYSVSLLRKAEKLALAYDNMGGISLRSAEARTAKPYIMLPSLQELNSRHT